MSVVRNFLTGAFRHMVPETMGNSIHYLTSEPLIGLCEISQYLAEQNAYVLENNTDMINELSFRIEYIKSSARSLVYIVHDFILSEFYKISHFFNRNEDAENNFKKYSVHYEVSLKSAYISMIGIWSYQYAKELTDQYVEGISARIVQNSSSDLARIGIRIVNPVQSLFT